MCFSETQSYIHTGILVVAGVYALPNYRLAIPAFFFALKELLQGLLYKYQGDDEKLKLFAALSWIHISLHPLMYNIVFSNFAPNHTRFWYVIFGLCIIYSLIMIPQLNEFDFQNDPDCSDKIGKGDFCAKKTGAYIGKYHIGYTFNTDVPFTPIDEWTYYQILGFGPALLTKARSISIMQAFLAILIYVIFNELNGIREWPLSVSPYNGEKAAIWCYLSIVLLLPIILFEKNIKKLLK